MPTSGAVTTLPSASGAGAGAAGAAAATGAAEAGTPPRLSSMVNYWVDSFLVWMLLR